MKDLVSKADSVVVKARRLMKHNHEMGERLTAMEKEIKDLSGSLEAERRKTNELNNQIKIIKLARNIGSGELFEDLNITELKRKLNEYIREIDKCIAMLND